MKKFDIPMIKAITGEKFTLLVYYRAVLVQDFNIELRLKIRKAAMGEITWHQVFRELSLVILPEL